MNWKHVSHPSLQRRIAAAVASVVGIIPAIATAGTTTHPTSAAQTLYPSVHWFAGWNESDVAKNPVNAFSSLTTYTGAVQPDAIGNLVTRKPTTAPTTAPTIATVAPRHPVATLGRAISYVFADFESNNTSLRSNPISTSVQPGNSSILNSATFRLFEPNLPNAIRDNEAAAPGKVFLTKAQYDIARIGRANVALYPGGISSATDGTLIDVFGPSTVQAHSGGAASPRLTSGLRGSGFPQFASDAMFYHSGVPWKAELSRLTSVSLKSDEHSENAQNFPVISGFGQFGRGASQPLSIAMVAGQMAQFRLRGAYSANAFERGLSEYNVADQEPDEQVNSNDNGIVDPSVAATRLTGTKRTTLTFNPTIDTTNAAETQALADVSRTIWSAAYARLTNAAEPVERGESIASRSYPNYSVLDVYEVFNRAGAAFKAPPATPDDGTPLTVSSALADASMHRLLEFNPAGARDYKGVSVVASESDSKPVWILNDSYTVLANRNRVDRGLPQPTLVGTLAAAASMAILCRRRRRHQDVPA